MYSFLGRSVLIAALVTFTGISVLAQKKAGQMNCNDERWSGDRLVGHCEMREQTFAPSGPISIDGKQNGGVSVKGWDQNQVLVRARVQTSAPTAEEAAALARQITVETGGSKIQANGPENRKNYNWSVSYEVFVPGRADLSLETHNGGIAISEVNGKIDFTALNGGVVLRNVGGAVRGSTTNGGLVVVLNGDRWDGETLDVKTTNGGIVMSVPDNYSANLQTGTVNGNISLDFPITVQGQVNKQISVNLGAGGPTIKVMTTNGGVRIKRLSNE